MSPSGGNDDNIDCSLSFLPAAPLALTRTLEKLFDFSKRPSRNLNHAPFCFASETTGIQKGKKVRGY